MGKLVWVFAILFTLLGAGLLVGSGWSLGNTLKFQKQGRVTEGQVVDFDVSESTSKSNGRTKRTTMYAPIVEYTDLSGTSQRIKSSVSSSSKGYDIGEKVNVRYLPSKPGEARIDSFSENWFLPLILGGIGFVVFAIGISSFVAAITKMRNRKWLKKNGTRIQAQYTGTIHDTSLKVNGRSPYRVTAQWQDPATNTMHSFKSDAIWYDPAGVIQQDTIDVVLNPANPKIYEVDIAFLPKSA